MCSSDLQPAQLTTVGKRATLWMNELLMDFNELEYRIANLKLLGSKGTTGTQASFMELFKGDTDKVKELEAKIAKEMGFDGVVPVSGQTYSRKIDSQILATLSGIAQSCSKFSNDMRLLQSFKEMEEPFEKTQIGSSAMAYKRNPMRCERITSLARYVMIDSLNPAFTAGTQWFERTLDDSANKRVSVPEAFLAVDAILNIMLNVTDGLVVYPKMIRQRIMRELPFMATENIMMDAVEKGQPPGTPREDPYLFHGCRQARQGRRSGQRPVRYAPGRPGVHDYQGRPGQDSETGEFHRPQRTADRGIRGRVHPADSGRKQGYPGRTLRDEELRQPHFFESIIDFT